MQKMQYVPLFVLIVLKEALPSENNTVDWKHFVNNADFYLKQWQPYKITNSNMKNEWNLFKHASMKYLNDNLQNQIKTTQKYTKCKCFHNFQHCLLHSNLFFYKVTQNTHTEISLQSAQKYLLYTLCIAHPPVCNAVIYRFQRNLYHFNTIRAMLAARHVKKTKTKTSPNLQKLLKLSKITKIGAFLNGYA